MPAAPGPLADALRLAGWGPRQLAIAINGWLSENGQPGLRIDVTAPYSWIKRGYLPRAPIPALAAAVLSRELGCLVTVEQLWPGRGYVGGPELAATDGLDRIETVEGVSQALTDLASESSNVSQYVVDASGADLTAAVLGGLEGAVRGTRGSRQRECVLPPQVDLIAEHVSALRRLDDRHGGSTLSLRYVTNELRGVLDLVRFADPDQAIGRRLLTIAGDLAQVVGWMQFDSGRFGLAERYLLLAMRIGRAVGEEGRTGNAIGMLAYVSSFAGHGMEALRLAEAAERACPRTQPVLQARIKGRVATAAAAAGDLARFREASDAALTLLHQHGTDGSPAYLYYLEPQQLMAETGQGLVWLAERVSVYRRRLLGEAIDLLTPISTIGQRPDYPRSAMLHAAFLAEAHLRRGELEQAVDAARAALARLKDVQSPRGRSQLERLRPALNKRKRSQVVADFLPELDAALSVA